MTSRDVSLACGDQAFPLLPPPQAARLVSMLGFSGFTLAVMGNRSQIQPDHVMRDGPGVAADVARLLAECGLKLADVFLIPWTEFEHLAPNHPDRSEREASRKLFKSVLELATRLESPGITLLPGVAWEDRPPRDSLERAAEELGWRCKQAAKAGLRCSIEPHIGSVVPTPEAVEELLELAPDLDLTLDYTHFVAQGIDETSVDPLIDRARHLHVRGARRGRGQCGLRDNTIDYVRIADLLASSGYRGFVEVEYVWIEWEGMNECDNLSETVLLRDLFSERLRRAP